MLEITEGFNCCSFDVADVDEDEDEDDNDAGGFVKFVKFVAGGMYVEVNVFSDAFDSVTTSISACCSCDIIASPKTHRERESTNNFNLLMWQLQQRWILFSTMQQLTFILYSFPLSAFVNMPTTLKLLVMLLLLSMFVVAGVVVVVVVHFIY